MIARTGNLLSGLASFAGVVGTEDCGDAVLTDVLRADEDGFGLLVEEAMVGPAVGLSEALVTVDGSTSAVMMHWLFWQV